MSQWFWWKALRFHLFLHVLSVKLNLDKCGVIPKRPNHTIALYIAIVFCEAEIVVDGRNSPTFTGSFRICHLSTHDYQSLSHMCLVAWKHQDGRTQANLGCINLVVNSGKQSSSRHPMAPWQPTFNPSLVRGDPSGSVVPLFGCDRQNDHPDSEPQEPSWEHIFLSSVGCSDTKNKPFQHISSGLPEASCGF